MRTGKVLGPAPLTVSGFHGVREALRGFPDRVRKVVLAEGRTDDRAQQILALARAKGIPVYREKAQVLDRWSSRGHHQGVLAQVMSVAWWDLDELLSTTPAPALLLALDRVEDPRNFGAVVRAADGAGVQGILVPHRWSAPPSEAAIAASAGALLHARLARVSNLTEALLKVKENRIWVVGLEPSASAAWFEFDYTQPVVVVLGSEGHGLRRLVAETCDQLVRLPQRGRVESLNVSVAAGVVLYEAVRQRGLREERKPGSARG